jgi:hypothetical protein
MNDKNGCCVVLCRLVGCNAKIRNMDIKPAWKIQHPRGDTHTKTSRRCRICNCSANGRRTRGAVDLRPIYTSLVPVMLRHRFLLPNRPLSSEFGTVVGARGKRSSGLQVKAMNRRTREVWQVSQPERSS